MMPGRPRTARLRAWLGRAAWLTGGLVACALFLEGATRAVHMGRAPLLPYYFANGAALLVPGWDRRASFYGRPPNRYTIDRWGARAAAPALAEEPLRNGVFVIGDSQVLGYMVDFEDTFASRVAAARLGTATAARMLAAPTNHPDTLLRALHLYAPSGLGRQAVAIVGLNLGNDLDEMYSEGLRWSRSRQGPFERFLLAHSFTYMDWVLIRAHRLNPGREPAGINPILYMLDATERIVLAREAVRALEDVIHAIEPQAASTVVVIVPADIQVRPDTFSKYQVYYSSAAEFARWHEQVPALAAILEAIEVYIDRQLRRHGHAVVRLSTALREHADGQVFDDLSHHLTPLAHGLAAEAILEALHEH